MSPEALARLRKDLADQVAPSRDDLRALLDAYDTARAEGVAAEREACAKLCDRLAAMESSTAPNDFDECAAAIRTRGGK